MNRASTLSFCLEVVDSSLKINYQLIIPDLSRSILSKNQCHAINIVICIFLFILIILRLTFRWVVTVFGWHSLSFHNVLNVRNIKQAAGDPMLNLFEQNYSYFSEWCIKNVAPGDPIPSFGLWEYPYTCSHTQPPPRHTHTTKSKKGKFRQHHSTLILLVHVIIEKSKKQFYQFTSEML